MDPTNMYEQSSLSDNVLMSIIRQVHDRLRNDNVSLDKKLIRYNDILTVARRYEKMAIDTGETYVACLLGIIESYECCVKDNVNYIPKRGPLSLFESYDSYCQGLCEKYNIEPDIYKG